MKININGKQATVEMTVEDLVGILEVVAKWSCGYREVATKCGTSFYQCCDYNDIAEEIADAIDTNKLDKIDKSFVDEIKKEMKRNGRE